MLDVVQVLRVRPTVAEDRICLLSDHRDNLVDRHRSVLRIFLRCAWLLVELFFVQQQVVADLLIVELFREQVDVDDI